VPQIVQDISNVFIHDQPGVQAKTEEQEWSHRRNKQTLNLYSIQADFNSSFKNYSNDLSMGVQVCTPLGGLR
jgi:hypothetical protein